MDVVEMNDDIAEFFNSELGSDLSNLNKLPEILERLSKYEEELEQEFNPSSSEPTIVEKCTKDAEEALKKIQKLSIRSDKLLKSSKSEMEGLKLLRDNFRTKMNELAEIKSLFVYLQWILKIENENSLLEHALEEEDLSEIVDSYAKMTKYWEDIRLSDCKNLVDYVKKTMMYWHEILLAKYGSEFQKTLKDLRWPVITSSITLSSSEPVDATDRFNKLFMFLHEITLPDSYTMSQDVTNKLDDSSLLLPMQLLLQPLQKRFVFHFMGNKATNNIQKPEWFFTQILAWLSDHAAFLESTVQPLLNKKNLSHIDANMQFMRGLVQLSLARLKADIPRLVDDDLMLSHTIDEVLLFSHELKAQSYPSNYPSLVQVLESEPCFGRWRYLEHQSALEKMDKILSLESAWKSQYEDDTCGDDTFIPESAELFITLLLTMTERYCQLSDKDCQVSFLELQLELLDDFRLRLHQVSQCQIHEAIQSDYCGIINAVHYVSSVLEEWNNLPFFVHLNSYRRKKKACEDLLKNAEKLSPFKRKESKPLGLNKEDEMEISVFDDIISLLEHMQTDLLFTMCSRIMMDVKAKSRPYRKEKWFCMTVPQDKKLLELSVSAFPMLSILSSGLCSLQELLAKPLFTKLWQQLALELNVYIFEEIVLQNSFNEGGAAQLSFDMSRNLFSIFGSYTGKPESYFNLIRDSCTILNMSAAPAMLLRETLKHQETSNLKCHALEELNVFSLSRTQALILLSQRTYNSSR